MRRIAIAVGFCLSAVVAAGPALALPSRESRERAPEISSPVWINSGPLTLAKLRGKVVLVDFWEYTCINCVRTFPYLRRWNALYAPLGLVIIGVHTPEFDFAKNPALVADAAKRFRLTFPIAVDSDRTIWGAFGNYAWPADYLIDRNGMIADVHVGEGNYNRMESEIQALLKEANPALNFSAAKYVIPADQPELGGACFRPTPEIYLGSRRARYFANPDGRASATGTFYAAPAALPSDAYALDGPWMVSPEFIHRPPSVAPGDSSLVLSYRAKSVYVVGGSADNLSERLYLTQDGKPLASQSRGVDVKTDRTGRTYIALGSKRMYYVVNNPEFGAHTLKLSTASTLALYSFTFGNNCETKFDHK